MPGTWQEKGSTLKARCAASLSLASLPLPLARSPADVAGAACAAPRAALRRRSAPAQCVSCRLPCLNAVVKICYQVPSHQLHFHQCKLV